MWLVPALRFPEFSGEWNTSSIEEQFELYSGNTPSRMDKKQFDGTVNWITSGELKEHYIADTKEKISDEAVKSNNLKLLPVGTFVIAIYGLEADGVRGTCSITASESTISQACMAFISKKDIANEFLYAWYKKHGNVIGIRYAQGTKQQNLSYDIIEKFNISYPCIEEQKKLIRFISLIDERIATQNKIIEKLETLIKGIRHKVFNQLRKDVGFNSTIGNILSFEQPQRYIVSSSEYSNDDSFTPVLTANKAFILGYTTETGGIYDKGDCIIIDDFTLDCKYVSFPFKIKSSAIKILTANNKLILRYTYEYLKSLELSTEEHKRHYITEIQPYSCVLPDDKILKTIALMFKSITDKLANEQSLAHMLNKQKKYLLSKMFI